MVLIHPYSLPLLLTLAVVLTVLRRRAETPGYLARYAIPVLPTAAYVASIAAFHPVVSRHSSPGAARRGDDRRALPCRDAGLSARLRAQGSDRERGRRLFHR